MNDRQSNVQTDDLDRSSEASGDKRTFTSARSLSSMSDSKRASETSGSKCTRSSVIERLASEKAKNFVKTKN